jgi:hypothetical protein
MNRGTGHSLIDSLAVAFWKDTKRKDAPVPEDKVISLGKRAEAEERPFFEQLLQEGARTCHTSQKDAVERIFLPPIATALQSLLAKASSIDLKRKKWLVLIRP